MKTIRDLDLKNKRVLVRVDFNVPQDKATREVTDDTRLRASLPTISYLIEQGSRVILASHLGRPDGQVVEKLRLDPVAKRLSSLLGKEVKKVNECIGPEADGAVSVMKPGDVVLLENLRFHPEEEANDPAFSRALASLADAYVNDAFGTAHRAHASTAGVAGYLPSAAGFLIEKEVKALGGALTNPARPFGAVIGGAKISSKIRVLDNLIAKVDGLFIGGAMACTFLKARGYEMGDSLVEDDQLDLALGLMKQAQLKGITFLLPVDAVVADRVDASAERRVVAISEVTAGWSMLDIGPATADLFEKQLRSYKTVLWNGPMGVFEMEPFASGTRSVAAFLANLDANTIVGGGESVAAVEGLGLADRFTHVSTGGGATLEFIEGRALPGIAALEGK
ncbi:MAG: phosphoglycerate kinase [Dehalococcoidia bacterium]|nr:phosphoglycerate kinase [Dehalococcoidia bacterium]